MQRMTPKFIITFVLFLWLIVSINAQLPESYIVNDILWNPVNNTIARTFEDGTIEIVDTMGNIVFSPTNNLSPATRIAWSPDGNRLAVGVSNRVRIWDVTIGSPSPIFDLSASSISGTFLSEFSGEVEEVILALEWSTTNQLVSLSTSGDLRIWNGNSSFSLAVDGGISQSESVAWSPDGSGLVSTSGLRVVYIDASTGLVEPWAENTYTNWGTAVDWNSTGDKVAIGTGSGDIVVINGETRLSTYLFHTNEDHQVITDLAWSPDGERLLASFGNTVRVYEGDSLLILSTITYSEAVTHVTWNPSGSIFAYIGKNDVNNIETAPAPQICNIQVSDGNIVELMAAIISANGTPEPDTICLEAGTYTLDAPITSEITLIGLGAGAEISGTLHVSGAGRLTLRNVSLNP